MKIKFTSKLATIRQILSLIDVDRNSDIEIVVDVNDTQRNRVTLEKFKGYITNQAAQPGFNNYSNPFQYNPQSGISFSGYTQTNEPNRINPYTHYTSDPFPTTREELDSHIRKVVYDILDEERGSELPGEDDEPRYNYSTNSQPSNLFMGGSFNPINQQPIPSQININQENELINSLLKTNVCGVDLNTVQGVALMTLAVVRSSSTLVYSISSSVIKEAIEWIRTGSNSSNGEVSMISYDLSSKIGRNLGVENWKVRINSALKYPSSRTQSLHELLNFMYS